MLKTAGIIGFIVLVLAGAGLLAFRNAHEKLGDQSIAMLIPVVEQVKQASGAYPATLDFKPKKVWGIFPGPEVVYRSDGAECDLYYYQWPWGPHHGFKCSKKEWYFAE